MSAQALMTLGQSHPLLLPLLPTALLIGSPDTAIQRVHSDTRSLAAGDLFVALRGERVDGHDFIPSAKTLGASAALVSRPSEELPCVVVESPLRAYGEIAKHYREMTGVKVVGITGSVGKTTTKEMIASVL